MVSSLPTLVMCHGAWHTPEYWSPIKNILSDKGYKCLAPDIIYNGRAQDKPVQSMTSVVDKLQEVIVEETTLGNNVVLVNHSMGGTAGTSATKGLTKRDPSRLGDASGHVIGLIQLTARTPVADGVSLTDMAQDLARTQTHPTEGGPQPKTDSSGWAQLQGNPARYFYNDLSAEEGQIWVSKLINFSGAMLTARDSVYAGWQEVPMWYLVCTEDKAISRQLQEYIVLKCREAGGEVVTRSCEAGHSPMLSKPLDTVAFIEDAVRAFGQRERL